MGAVEVVQEALEGLGLEWSRRGDTFTVPLPGEHKLTTECALEVGAHSLQVRAFVVRAPEQDADRVHRWLLERNLRLAGIAFGVDHLGDVYLVGRLPLAGLEPGSVDQLLGAVAETADGSFDPLVAMGFADSIRREWAWRRSRGESTRNLEAFRHLDPGAGAEVPRAGAEDGDPMLGHDTPQAVGSGMGRIALEEHDAGAVQQAAHLGVPHHPVGRGVPEEDIIAGQVQMETGRDELFQQGAFAVAIQLGLHLSPTSIALRTFT